MISLLPLLLVAAQDPAPTGAPAPAEAPSELRLVLPPGPVADLLASPEAPAQRAAHRARQAERAAADGHLAARTELPAWETGGLTAWEDDSPWRWWRELWTDEVADEGRPSAFWLARVARAQGRHADVWTHLADLDAGQLQDALEVLVPGVVRNPGDPTPLMVPLLPPVPVHDPATWEGLPPLREYTARGVRLGETTFDMTVSVPGEGVEVKLEHVAGPPLRLRLRVPVPPTYERTLEYLDWERLDELPEHHELLLAPADEERVVWVRCLPQDEPWPRLAAGAGFPTDRELVVRTTADDPALAQVAAFVAAVDALLPNPVRLDTDPAPPGRDLVLDLSPGPRRLDKLRAIVGQVEQHLRGRAGR